MKENKVSKLLKITSDRLTPSVHFANHRTTSHEVLVEEEGNEEEEEERELKNEDDLVQVTRKESTVEIVTTDIDQGVHANGDRIDNDEHRESAEKEKLTCWSIWKWFRLHLRLRKWFSRGLQAFGQGFLYTSPMSATVVVAQEMNKRNHIYKRSSGVTTHYF